MSFDAVDVLDVEANAMGSAEGKRLPTYGRYGASIFVKPETGVGCRVQRARRRRRKRRLKEEDRKEWENEGLRRGVGGG